MPENLRVTAEIGGLTPNYGGQEGLRASSSRRLMRSYCSKRPTWRTRWRGNFACAVPREVVARLEALPQDVRDRTAWRAIAVPALILATGMEPVYRLAYASTLAAPSAHACAS